MLTLNIINPKNPSAPLSTSLTNANITDSKSYLSALPQKSNYDRNNPAKAPKVFSIRKSDYVVASPGIITDIIAAKLDSAMTPKLQSQNKEDNISPQMLTTEDKTDDAMKYIMSEREEIRIDQMPTQKTWAFIPLYKISANGGLLYWQVGFDGINHLEMSYGYTDGIIRTDRTQIKLNTTGHNIWEQSLLDARQQYKLKYREGYQPAGATIPPLIKGMKGYEYKENSIKSWPVYTQPKLNGVRMLCQDMGVNQRSQLEGQSLFSRMVMRSWLNNLFNNLTHLEPELRDFFEYLPRYATLDGELYNHDLDFTMLISAVKTVKSTHPRLHEVQYWIFDINYEDSMGTPFEKRYELLVNAFKRYIQDRSAINDSNDITALPKTFRIVPSQIARNHLEIISQHDQYVAIGYEGIMVKKISNNSIPGSKIYLETLYKSGKGNHILKYKMKKHLL